MCDGEICELVTQQAGQTTPPPSQPTSSSLSLSLSRSTSSQRPDDDETETPQQQQQQQQPPQPPPQLKLQAKMLREKAGKDEAMDVLLVSRWQVEDVLNWANNMEHISRQLLDCLRLEAIDGEVLLALTEEDVRDMRYKLNYKLTFGELKKFWLAVLKLQLQVKSHGSNGGLNQPMVLGIAGHLTTQAAAAYNTASSVFMPLTMANTGNTNAGCPCPPECPSYVTDCEAYLRSGKSCVAPEYFKTAISLGYSFLVTWITSFVMVIVHERVPDMKRYPPLPDIFLDNVPHIPWAFNMCEITGSLLFTIWMMVLIFHKYRMVLLRRFFALAGTVFLLRCVTMLITSLSVPGTHLQCNQKDFAIDDPNVDMVGALFIRMTRAYKIWSGLGMSIQGVRTCGDYMFSGHTVALTLLNFFITEYTPRNLYFLHTLTWLLNMFGIFFILAAHEHYSIDVFVAFYITSRLFLYYHTLANNRALMQSDSTRTRIWFPMFSYFESSVDGIIPNEFDTPGTLVDSLFYQIIRAKETIVVTVHRYFLDEPISSKSSMQMFNSDTDLCGHAHAAGSSYFSPRQSTISGIQSNSHRRSSRDRERERERERESSVGANATTTTTATYQLHSRRGSRAATAATRERERERERDDSRSRSPSPSPSPVFQRDVATTMRPEKKLL